MSARATDVSEARRSDAVLLATGFGVGLLLRLGLLARPGTFDVDIYASWARVGLEQGLVAAYTTDLTNAGSYYPFEMAILIACQWLADATGVGFHGAVKGVNALFDAGLFAVLLAWLPRVGAPRELALVQWLHPWFLTIFSLGYVDAHFAFFLLLSVAALHGEPDLRRCLLAGVPLGIAFTMKPQAQVPMLALGAFAVFHALRQRDFGPLALGVFPVMAFVGWSLVFAASSQTGSGSAGLAFLAERYLAAGDIVPCLNGTRLNLWYPIAEALRPARAPVWAVSDAIPVLGAIEVRHLAAVAVLAGVIGFAWRASRAAPSVSLGERLWLVLAFAGLVVPYVMTQAHENHFYVGSLLALPLLVASRDRALAVALHVILVLDAANAFVLYEQSEWARTLRRGYTPELRTALSFVSTGAFVLVVRGFLRRVPPEPARASA